MKEILLKILLPTLAAVGEPKLVELLEKLAVLEGDENFATDIQGTYRLFQRLASLAETTKTPFDDAVIGIVNEAIAEVAKAHNIQL